MSAKITDAQRVAGFDTGPKHLISVSHLVGGGRLLKLIRNSMKDILLVISLSIFSIKDNEGGNCAGEVDRQDVSLWQSGAAEDSLLPS